MGPMIIPFALLPVFHPLPSKPMKTLKNLFQALGILALGFLIIGTIVWLLVDAILGGAL